MELRAIAGNEVARFDGIGLAHLRWRDDTRELFQKTMLAALRLIQERDPRRFRRVKRHVKWITNRVSNMGGASYEHAIQTCNLELQDLREVSYDVHVAFHACLVIHEATHGAVEARGIPYNDKDRTRIERLCTAEQNRFAVKLAAFDPGRYPAWLQLDFDEELWREEWTMTKKQWLRAFMRHWWSDTRAEPCTAPNGGPSALASNSRTPGGPPSVS